MLIYCTYCAKEKDESPERLSPIQRYRSDRISRIARLASRDAVSFYVLSGEFGLVHSTQDTVPPYDHLLQPHEVPALVERVVEQLIANRIASVHYFTPHPEGNLTPYYEVISLATQKAGVAFETETLGEQQMSDWRHIMELADQAKHTLIRDRAAGERQFEGLMRQYPGDPMLSFKRAEALHAVSDNGTALSEARAAAAGFPKETWRANALRLVRQLEEATGQTPAVARPTGATAALDQLPAELQEHWKTAFSQTGGIEFVVRCRAALERTTEHLLGSGTGTVPSRAGLVEGIKTLQAQGGINSVTATHMHTIRTLGNEAVHRGGIGEDEVAACRTAALAIIKVVIGTTSTR